MTEEMAAVLARRIVAHGVLLAAGRNRSARAAAREATGQDRCGGKRTGRKSGFPE